MTGIEIFFCGGFLLTAIFCLLFLTGIIKPVSQKPSEEKVEESPPKDEVKSDNIHVVAPSKFNVVEFMAQISSEVISDVRKELPTILRQAIGDVRISDVKFEDGFEDDSEPDEEFVPRKFKALNSDKPTMLSILICEILTTRHPQSRLHPGHLWTNWKKLWMWL